MASFAISLSLVIAVAAVIGLVVVGLAMPRFANLAGGLIGIGGTWSALTLMSLEVCERTPQDYCSGGFVPLLVVGAALVVAGSSLAAWTATRTR